MKKPYRTMPNLIFDHYMLRTISKKDAKDMYDYGKNPEVVKYLSWGPMKDLKDAKYAIKTVFLPRFKKGLPIGYAIVDLLSDKMIGTIDFHTKDDQRNGAEIGYVLHQDYWNKGIMSEALAIMLDVGFTHLRYDIIKIKHLVDNIASQKVILKTPFSYVGREAMTITRFGTTQQVEMFCYELTKEAYHGYQQSKGNV